VGDEQDSWFKDAFGVDLGQSLQSIEDQAAAAWDQAKDLGGQVVQGVQDLASAASGAVQQVTGGGGGAGGGSSGDGGGAGGGTGSFPLGGSVGRGGKNAASDVRAVQAALGISVDGQCGGQTIAAIEAFQRTLGQTKPDGRVDAGGATERALAGGARPAPAPADDSPSLFDKAVQGAEDLAGELEDLGGRIIKEVEEVLDDSVAPRDLSNLILPDLPPRPPPDETEDPNLVLAGEHFRMKMLEGLSFGEVAGLTTFTFVIWDVDNNRAAVYEYAAVIVTAGTPITFTGEGDWSSVFTTVKPMQVDQFSCNASHGSIGALNLGLMVMNLDHATVNVPTGFSKGGGFEAGGGFFSLVSGSVNVFKGP
jgi:hypothetical protein